MDKLPKKYRFFFLFTVPYNLPYKVLALYEPYKNIDLLYVLFFLLLLVKFLLDKLLFANTSIDLYVHCTNDTCSFLRQCTQRASSGNQPNPNRRSETSTSRCDLPLSLEQRTIPSTLSKLYYLLLCS